MSNLFHSILGKYHIADRWMGIDYNSLLLKDPVFTDTVLFHETVHNILAAQTDFGQFTFIIFKALNDFKLFNDTQKTIIERSVYNAQLFVQEGFATFLELSWLRKSFTRDETIGWAKKNLPPDYWARFKKLLFAFDMSPKYRDFFTAKVSQLVMDTGIRRFMSKEDLLRDPKRLQLYLEEVENNPDLRLGKVIEVLKYKPWLVTKTIPEIATASGITWHEPSSNAEIVQFLNYVSGHTNHPQTFSDKNIVKAPSGEDAILEAKKNLIVANMNFRFQPSEVIFKNQDFLFHAERAEYVFVGPMDNWSRTDEIEKASGIKPDVSIAAFLPYGEKYITPSSKEEATKFLNNQLKNASLVVKWGAYDIVENIISWLPEARPPDVIIYNSPQAMLDKLRTLLDQNVDKKFIYIHAAAAEGHPLRTLFLTIEGYEAIHIVNDYGGKDIAEILRLIEDRSRIMTEEEFRKSKKHINNAASFWLGLNQEIDWVESMIDKETIIFRK